MFSDRLKYLRSTEDLTQRDLALKLGITSGAVGMYESGKRFPDNTILNKIADYFHVSTDYLLGRTDDPLPVRDVDQNSHDELDVESKWLNFLKNLSGDSMFQNYENITEDDKLAIMEDYEKQQQKKQQKVKRFMDFPEDIIDDAYLFAKYAADKRKLNDD